MLHAVPPSGESPAKPPRQRPPTASAQDKHEELRDEIVQLDRLRARYAQRAISSGSDGSILGSGAIPLSGSLTRHSLLSGRRSSSHMDGGQGGGDINARINSAGGDGSRSALLSLLVALMEESHASVLSLVSRTTPPASGGAVDMTVGLLDESLHLHGRLDKITAQLEHSSASTRASGAVAGGTLPGAGGTDLRQGQDDAERAERVACAVKVVGRVRGLASQHMSVLSSLTEQLRAAGGGQGRVGQKGKGGAGGGRKVVGAIRLLEKGIGGEAGQDGLEEVAVALSTTFEQAESLMEESSVYAAAIQPLQATRGDKASKQPPAGGGVGVAELERRLKAVKGEIERLTRRRRGAGGLAAGEGASAGGDRQNERLSEVRKRNDELREANAKLKRAAEAAGAAEALMAGRGGLEWAESGGRSEKQELENLREEAVLARGELERVQGYAQGVRECLAAELESVRELEAEEQLVDGEIQQSRGHLGMLSESNMAAAEKDEESFAAAIALEWQEMRDAFDAQVKQSEARYESASSEHARYTREVRDAAVAEIISLRGKIEAMSRGVANAPRVGFEAGPAVPSTPRNRPVSARPSRPGTAAASRT